MTSAKTYYIPSTDLIPNSPKPLLHYPDILSRQSFADKHEINPNARATEAYDLFTSNGWDAQWVFRYGLNQQSHYHSRTHECMAVLSGTATIRFGAADRDQTTIESIEDARKAGGGVEVHAEAGDVFVIPAGVSHKTFDTIPRAEFALMTPGDGHSIDAEDKRSVLQDLSLDGFCMIGAYPREGGEWDFAVGQSSELHSKSWAIPNPQRDPVLGVAAEGLCGLWV